MDEQEFEQRMSAINSILAPRDQAFFDLVMAPKSIGFGRMMQIVSHTWRAYLEIEHPGSENGALVSGLFDDMPEDQQRAYLDIHENDPSLGSYVEQVKRKLGRIPSDLTG